MNDISDLNEFLIPLGCYVTIPEKGVFMIHDSISYEELCRVFHLEDVLWYLVDHRNIGDTMDSIIEEPDRIRGDDPLVDV